MNLSRRELLRGAAASWAAASLAPLMHGFGADAGLVGSPLSPWEPGSLDIHHISTGRGNSALIVLPDGTSVLVDAGASLDRLDVSCAPKPDGSRRPGQWIARYVQRHLRQLGTDRIDVGLVTHLHPDHVGDVSAISERSSKGAYYLSGLTDVADAVPIGLLVDRGFPTYSYPARPIRALFAENYLAYVEARRSRGEACVQAEVGSDTQIGPYRAPKKFGSFRARVVAANGVVWTGEGRNARPLFPRLATLDPSDYPDENMCSIALKLEYGDFGYYSGGDLSCSDRFGTEPWRDVETAVAGVTGPVSVALANHHAYFDSTGPEFVRRVRPRVWVVPAWHITHLNLACLERMLSPVLYPGPRDVVLTSLVPATALLDARFMPKVQPATGHVVVRVAPGGSTFRVFVTSNEDESDKVLAVLGPFPSKSA